MSNYTDLCQFVKNFKGSKVELAKIITAWEWTSLLPKKQDLVNVIVDDVIQNLSASCGWRDILLKALFSEIGIEGRRVNFYDVPFQGGHTATELRIDGKWMFFDSTFGTYFEKPSGGAPLSLAEARALWPDVVVKQALGLEGFRGVYVDPVTINPEAVYNTIDQTELFLPTAYAGTPFVLGGEVASLYFGYNSAYYFGPYGKNDSIELSQGKWTIHNDQDNQHSWTQIANLRDLKGRADYQYALNDDGTRWFKDWDQSKIENWSMKVTGVNEMSRLDYSYSLLDDGSKIIFDVDQAGAYTWLTKKTFINSRGEYDRQLTLWDDGSSAFVDWDERNENDTLSVRSIFNSSGEIINTSVAYDNGSSSFVNWIISSPLLGSSRPNELIAREELSLLMGGAGDDVYIISRPTHVVYERKNDGTDTVYTSVNYQLPDNVENGVLRTSASRLLGNDDDNWLYGNNFSNRIECGDGNDRVFGGEGNDDLIGGGGNDYIWGGLGFDTLTGSDGADIFFWNSTQEMGAASRFADIVIDFSGSSGDRLHLRAIDANELATGIQRFEFIGRITAFSKPGQVGYKFNELVNETWVMLNTDGDPFFESLLRISGKHELTAAHYYL